MNQASEAPAMVERLLREAERAGAGYRGRMPLVEWVRLDEGARRRVAAEGVAAVRPVKTLEEEARSF